MRSRRDGWRLRIPLWLLPWLLGVGVYWWYMVPLVPDLVIPFTQDDQAWGYTARGDIVVSHAWADLRSGGASAGGPVDVVSSVSGKVLARCLNKGDLILTWPAGGSHIAAYQRGHVRVVELETNREIVSLPVWRDWVSVAFSREEVAIAFDQQVNLYSLKTGAELWKHEFTIDEMLLPPERRQPGTLMGLRAHVRASFREILRVDVEILVPGGQPRTRRHFMNAKTGELDRRFGIVDEMVESRDGRLAILGESQSFADASPSNQRVYDLVSNQVLWDVPKGSGWCEFSPDGSEVWGYSRLDAQLTRRRWRAADGTLLDTSGPAGDHWSTEAVSSDDGRYFAGEQSVLEKRAPDSLMRIVKWIGIRWDGVLQPSTNQTCLVLADSWMNRRWVLDVFTPPPGERAYHYDLQYRPLGDGRRFTIHRDDHVAVYRFAVPRDWWWLIRWALFPWAIWMALQVAVRGAGALFARQPPPATPASEPAS
jgi:hypothetical protein